MSNFQKVSIVDKTAVVDGKFTVTVRYESSSAEVTGVGFKLHFDGASLAVDDVNVITTVDNTANGAVNNPPELYEPADHNDPHELVFGWGSMGGTFPGSEQADLATITFTELPDGLGNDNLYISPSSNAVGYDFIAEPGLPLEVSVQSIDENSGVDQEIATVANGPSGVTYELIDNTIYPSAETQVVIPDQQANTQHVYVSSSTLSEDGTQVTIKVSYKADDANLTGVGFKLNFDSSVLSGAVVSDMHTGQLIAAGTEGPELSDDGDASTDRELVFAWAATGAVANFPGVNELELATITFDVVPGAGGATPINLTQSSGASGFAYDNPEHIVQLPAASQLSIDPDTGSVTVTSDPDFESVPSYDFKIVTANGVYGSSASVNVVNLDEAAAVFDDASRSAAVDESEAVIFTAQANDSADVSAGVTYSLSGDDASLLSINSAGEVTVNGGADFETKTSYSFTVNVTDGINDPVAESSQDVVVAINNVDDTGPIFTVAETQSVDEGEVGAVGTAATAVDDQTDLPSDSITYSLADDANGTFVINSSNGAISIVQAADHETQSSYNLVIRAQDGNGNTTDQAVTIAIVDIDEVAPTINSADIADNLNSDEPFHINENSGANQVVYTATADDTADVSGGVTFSLAGADANKFTINSANGEVTLKEDPDYESESLTLFPEYDEGALKAKGYTFDVIATDAAGLSGSKSVTLLINDVADAKPIFDSGDVAAAVLENTDSAEVVYTANANPVSPEGQTVSIASYELTDDANGKFTINGAGEVSFTGGADFETQNLYSFTVKATDTAGNHSSQIVNLDITNVDDTAPVVKGTDGDKNLNAYTGEGQVVFNAQNPIQGEQAYDDPALDVTSALSFEILEGEYSDRFAVDANGVVTYLLDPKLDDNLPEDQESQTIPYSLKVIDDAGNESVLELQITISGAELNIPEFDTPAGYAAEATADVVRNAGTDNELTVTVVTEVSGDLDGVADGDVIYSAVVEDATPVTYAVGTTLSISEDASPLHTVDTSAAALTSGYLSVDPAGVVTIHGQPWEDGATEFNFTVTATDASGNVANQSVTLDVTGYTGSASSLTGVTYGLESSNGDALVDSQYAIDRDSGEITFVGGADYEARPNYDFNVVVNHDAGSYSYGVFLAVEDVLDTGPAITSASSVSVTENTDLVYQITSEADSDNDNSGVIYGIQGADASAFNVDAEGNITLADNADHETQSEYNIVVTATANGFTSEQAVTVTVDDVDEYAPVFTSADSVQIDELDETSHIIYTATAHDVGSVDAAGAIAQEFVQNDDGTLTVKFFVDSAPFSTLEVADFDFSFEPEQDGVLAVESIDFPANPMVRLVNDDVDGQINFALIFRDKYQVDGDLAIAEVTFKVGDPAVSTQFSVSDVSLGDAGSAESLAGSVVNYVMDAPNAKDDPNSDNPLETIPAVTFGLLNSDGETVSDYNGFSIDSQGNVSIADANFEEGSEQSFTVVATDGQNSSSKEVKVVINNTDEVAPTITSSAEAVAIDENSGSGQVVYTATSDDSADISAGVTYSLSGDDADSFAIDAQSGEVTLLDNPDYETQSNYSFDVTATDGINTSTESVTLAINNLDEVAPKFEETDVFSVTETEDYVPDRAIYDADHIDVHVNESATNGVTYSLASTNTDTLTIDENTGVVSVSGSIDHETLAQYSFTVVATDAAGNASKQAITIDVDDIDETAPVFTSGTTALNIDENATGEALNVYKIIADDSSDVVGSGEITYGLTADGDRMSFDFDSENGTVTLKESPDFEVKPEYSFTIKATDEGGNTSTQTITLKVNDFDEKAPVFAQSEVVADSIVENSGTNQVVYTAAANDIHSDEATSDGFAYALGGADADAFTIDANTGEVRLIDNPDHDEKSSYSFTVIAIDNAGNKVVVDGNEDNPEQQVTLQVTPKSEVTVAHWGSDVHIGKVKVTGSDKVVETDGKRSASIAIDEDSTQLSAQRELEASDVSGVINSADALQVLNIAARSATINNVREYKYDASKDFDGDGKVDDVDITMMAADINNDGKVNSRDALEILKISVRMDDALDTEWLFAEVNADANTQDTAGYIGFVRGDVNASWNNSENVDSKRSTDKGAEFTTASSIEIYDDAAGVIYKAAADDDNYEVTYKLVVREEGQDPQYVTEHNGFSITESGVVSVDEVTAGSTSFEVAATDVDGNITTQTVDVKVDVKDTLAPVITVDGSYTGTISEIDSVENQVVYQVKALVVDENGDPVVDNDGNNIVDAVEYKLGAGSDPALSINADGEVTLSNKADEDIQSEYHFTVIATDEAGNETKEAHVIQVSARDEVAPTIVSDDSAASIDEHVDGLFVIKEIYKAKAIDTDHDGTESIQYSLLDEPSNLSIDQQGVVRLTSAPDYEAESEITFTVIAFDGSNESRKEVTIAVNNLDEVAPKITSSTSVASIDENSGAGQLVYTAKATDSDDYSDGVTFSLSGTHAGSFTIDAKSGEVRLIDDPDFEDGQDVYNFTVEATDAAGESSSQSLTLSINNVDEDKPVITLNNAADGSNTVAENTASGHIAYTVTVEDDSNYNVVLSSDSDKAVSLENGNIVLNASPDHEMQKEYKFEVIATDAEGNSHSVTNSITVTDVDDAAPVIKSESARSVAEGNVSGDVIYQVVSDDTADMKAAEDTVSYALIAGKGSEQKEVAADTQLVYVGSDTLQKGNQIEVAVNYHAASADLTGLGLRVHYDSSKLSFVSMDDVLQNGLIFEAENFVNADSPEDSYVTIAWASVTGDWTGDQDELPELLFNAKFDVVTSETSKSEISFSAIDTALGYDFASINHELKLSPVSINTETGAISLTADTDFEASEELSFTVVAEDSLGNSSNKSVKVAIDNIDDTAPVITTESVSISLDEIHKDIAGPHKIPVYTVAADDSQDVSYGDVTYKLANHDSSLAINSATGEVYFISHPDFELNEDADTGESKYEFTVIAEDAAGIQSTKQVTLNINNIDEQAPIFTSSSVADDLNGTNHEVNPGQLDENTVGAQLVYTAATSDHLDITDNNTTYSLTSDSDGAFSIDATTGEVYFNDSADYEATPEGYTFTVVATDAGGNSREQNVSLAIGNLDEVAPEFHNSSDEIDAVENTTLNLSVSAVDGGDISHGVNYHLIGDDAELFDITDSGLITQGDETEFDYETKSEYNFTVVATDEAGNTSADSQQDITVNILNADEVNPEITSAETAQAVVAANPAAVIYTASATDFGDRLDAENAELTFSVEAVSVEGVDQPLHVVVSGDQVSLKDDVDPDTLTSVDFVLKATDEAGNSSEQKVSIPVISSINTSESATTEGGIVHTYSYNSDGTVTVKLSIGTNTGIEDQDITNLDFNLEYNSALAAFDGYPDVIASNPDMHIATPAVDAQSNNAPIANTLSISQVYMNGYDTEAGLAIFEHTFVLPENVSGDLFTVSNLTIGESDTPVNGNSSSLADIPENTGTESDDVVVLEGGFADVNLGAGNDTLIVASGYDGDIVIDFDSISVEDDSELGVLGSDSIDMTQILQDVGYGEGQALQVSGSTPDIADLISNSDESLDNTFGGYFNDDADVLTLFVDASSDAGVTNIETIELTLSDSSSFEDEDLSVNFANFIA